MPCHASPITIASIIESIGCFSSDLRVFMTPGPGRVDPYGGLESTNICAIPHAMTFIASLAPVRLAS